MTEARKHRINFSVIDFVNRYSDEHSGAITINEILDAYGSAHGDLLEECGIEPDQLRRMIRYVLEIGYPEDPWLCAGYDLDKMEDLAPSRMSDALLAGAIAAADLREREYAAVTAVMRRTRNLIEPYLAGPKDRQKLLSALRALESNIRKVPHSAIYYRPSSCRNARGKNLSRFIRKSR